MSLPDGYFARFPWCSMTNIRETNPTLRSKFSKSYQLFLPNICCITACLSNHFSFTSIFLLRVFEMTKKLKFRYGQNLEAPSQNFGLVIDQYCRTVKILKFFIFDSRDKKIFHFKVRDCIRLKFE